MRRLKYNFDGQPLGEVPDPVIAKEMGCSLTAVALERKRRGIPACCQKLVKKTVINPKLGKCQKCGKKGVLDKFRGEKLCPLCLNPPYDTSIERSVVEQSHAKNADRGWC